MLDSEDDRDAADDEAGERITSTASLFNYQSFMDIVMVIWQFGTDFSYGTTTFS